MTAHDRPHTSVCDPTGAPNAPPKQLAPRLQSLRGARVALLDNGKEFSDDVINAIGTVLKHELGVKEVRVWDKQFPAKGAPFLPELARSCDAVITGVGHWGSSAPWSARDAAALEDLGVPTATICSIAFAPLARVVARGLGHSSLPIAIVPHPVGDAQAELVTRKGIDVAAECIRMLTTPSGELDAEFRNAKYPLPPATVPK